MATHSSVLAWRIPGTEEPGGLPSMGSHRVRHDWSDLAAAAAAIFLCIYVSVFICSSVSGHLGCFYILAIVKSAAMNTGVGCHFLLQCMRVKSESQVAQSCPTCSDPMDCSPPGSSVHGIFQARVQEWGATAFSIPSFSSVQSLSRVRLLVTPWTAAHQAPPSMGFSRQEYRSGVPLPSPT